MKENMHFEVIKYLSHLVCAFNKVKGMMKFMNEYDSKYWKHGSSISLHFSPDGNIFSVDCNSLSDLPEYEECSIGEITSGAVS